MTDPQGPRIAILVPCHNEATAIGVIVRAFRARLAVAAATVG